MSLMENSLTMVSCSYESELPYQVQKKDLIVKEAFLLEDKSIAVWLQNSKKMNNDILYCSLHGKSIRYPLTLRSTVKQLNKGQLLVLNHDDASVDRLELGQQKLIKSKVRSSQSILLAFKSEMFVFKQSQSFCILERYVDRVQKIVYYTRSKDGFDTNHEFTMDAQSSMTIQLNKQSKIGWLYSSSYHILTILDLRNNIDPLKKITMPTSIDLGFEGKPSFQSYQILHISQLYKDIYLFYSSGSKQLQEHSRYWFVDGQRQGMPHFIRKVASQDNEDVFGFKQYYLKILGDFVIYQGEQYQHLRDTAHPCLKLDPEGKVCLGIKKNKLMHDEEIGFHSFQMEVKQEEKWVSFKVTWQISLKQQFMLMLLHIFEDFDDDLLQDIISLLP